MNFVDFCVTNFECSICGCKGIHACIGHKHVWTQEEEERFHKLLEEIFKEENKNEQSMQSV